MAVNGRIVEGSKVKLVGCLRLDFVVRIESLKPDSWDQGTLIPQTRVHLGTEGVVKDVYASEEQAIVEWDTGQKCRLLMRYLALVK